MIYQLYITLAAFCCADAVNVMQWDVGRLRFPSLPHDLKYPLMGDISSGYVEIGVGSSVCNILLLEFSIGLFQFLVSGMDVLPLLICIHALLILAHITQWRVLPMVSTIKLYPGEKLGSIVIVLTCVNAWIWVCTFTMEPARRNRGVLVFLDLFVPILLSCDRVAFRYRVPRN